MTDRLIHLANGGYLVLKPEDNLKSFEHKLIAKIISGEFAKADIAKIVSDRITCHSLRAVESIANDIRTISKRYYETPNIRLWGNPGISNLIFLDNHLREFIDNTKKNIVNHKSSAKAYPSFRLIDNKNLNKLDEMYELLYEYGFINDSLRKFKSIFKGNKISEAGKVSWEKSFGSLRLFVFLIHCPAYNLCEYSNVAYQETAINCISKQGKNIKINQINKSDQPSKSDSQKIYKVTKSLLKES